MSLTDKASKELHALIDQLGSGLEAFFLGYQANKFNNTEVVQQIGKLVKIHSNLLSRLNHWLSHLHQKKDFTIDATLRQDYLVTSSNITNTSFKFYDLLKHLSQKQIINYSSSPPSSFYVIQSFLGTFAADSTKIETLKQEFKKRNISTEGFNHKFEETVSKAGSLYSILKAIRMNLLEVIKEATKAVPFVKYALGLAGIGAAAALIKTFDMNPAAGFITIAGLLILMTILFLLARASQNPKNSFIGPIKFLLWFIVVIFIVTSSLFVSCIFFKKPQDLSAFILPKDKDSTKINKPEPNPLSPTHETITGHIYDRHDNSPIAEATVIPSFEKSPVITGLNGSFKFELKPEEIDDTVQFSVRSAKYKGITVKKFGKDQVNSDCRIYLSELIPPQPPSNVRRPSTARSARVPHVCDLIGPLRRFINEGETNYAVYQNKNYQFRDAEEIYKTNVAMNKHIAKYSNLIPVAIDKDFNVLIQHLTIWIRSFEDQVKKENPNQESTFRVIHSGIPFPVESVERIKAYATCN